MKLDRNFPRWSAPLMGMAFGVVLALKTANRVGEGFSPLDLVYGMVLGGLAGGLIFLVDTQPTNLAEIEPGDPGTVIGRFFAVLSIPLFVIPVLGLLWAVLAYFKNRTVQGWPKTVSKIGLGLSVAMSLLYLFIFATNK